mmetsp:Transcript_27006/g.68062  ORF Transcript_27006/g.68062 Transcript_27006/m.68062 type:complete len:213 (+) Transcript_27006:2007-2645(+)
MSRSASASTSSMFCFTFSSVFIFSWRAFPRAKPGEKPCATRAFSTSPNVRSPSTVMPSFWCHPFTKFCTSSASAGFSNTTCSSTASSPVSRSFSCFTFAFLFSASVRVKPPRSRAISASPAAPSSPTFSVCSSCSSCFCFSGSAIFRSFRKPSSETATSGFSNAIFSSSARSATSPTSPVMPIRCCRKKPSTLSATSGSVNTRASSFSSSCV